MRHYFKFTPAKVVGLVTAIIALGVTYNALGPDEAKAVGLVITAIAAMFSDPMPPTENPS